MEPNQLPQPTVEMLTINPLKLFLILTVLSANLFGSESKPNFLIIMCDDLGYADTGFTGSTVVETPNLDRLAENGAIIHNGYVTHPYCGPSRAGFVTGRYQARFGSETNYSYSPYDIHQGLPLDEKTFATRLKPAGYRTGIIGKWHLGASHPFHPNSRGFDYFYGFLSGGHDFWPEMVDTHPELLLANGNPNYGHNEGCTQPLLRNTNAAEFEEYLTTALTKDAARFMKQSDKPFCLFLTYNAPHGPLHAPKELIEKYKAKGETGNRAAYLAMIESMDQGIGMLISALKESGKFDNTILFFLSDNGGVAPKVNHMNEDWADNGPLRKGKGSMYEGGSKVPFIVHWPDGIPAGLNYDYPVSSLDIAATAVALGGGDTSGHKMDGVNLIPHLNGENPEPPHEAIYWRVRDNNGWAIRTPTHKMLKEGYSQDGPQLFDMVNDPYESTNIIEQSPELRQQLAQMWNDWNAQNVSSVFLQAGEYQKARLNFYKELHEDLKAKAAARKLHVIE